MSSTGGGPTDEAIESPAAPGPVNRRRFLKYAAVGGFAAAAGALAAGYLGGYIRFGAPAQTRPWEVAPGVVDYDRVPIPARGDTVTLRIAQWFDYWPGTFLDTSDWSFVSYMEREHGIRIRYQIDYFTSNEELFLWISPLQQKKYDLFFPSNYYVDLFNNAGWVYNLNPEWLPNLRHVDPRFLNTPEDDPFDIRPDGSRISIPYFWGTTGIGYRTDVLDPVDLEALGWDVFLRDAHNGQTLQGRMNLLDDQRDVITTGLKGAGWEWQMGEGMTPTGDLPPNGQQWTSNEIESWKVADARGYLLRARPNIFDFNSTTVITSLQTGAAWVNHAWSGDAILANAPDITNPFPVEYSIPKQGATWWVDAMSIHSQASNLWVAHEFLNYIHEPDVMRRLTEWNRYSTANLATMDLLTPFPNGWDMREDPRLYPDEATWRRLDLTRDVGLEALNALYNPLWDELRFGAQG